MKQFDDIFTRKVKDAFSNYNADHLADDAWKSFTRKKRRKGAVIIPLWAKAASVAVLITGAGIIAYNTFFTKSDKLNEVTLVAEQQEGPGEAIERDIAAREVKETPAENTGVSAKPVIPPDLTITEEQTASGPAKSEQVTPGKLPVLTAGLRLLNTGKLIDEISNPGLISYYEPFTGTATREQKTGLMAGLSGMVSRVDDNADPGTSMGVYIERKLSDRISVRPGIAFSYQDHNLSGNSTLKESMAYAAPLTDVSSMDVENTSAQLNLLAFEIPLDLVFTVWERRRSNVYLSAGASTMVYLNQKFDGSFTNTYIVENYNSVTGDLTYERNSSLLDVESNYGAFSHVDFMGLANFSAGFSMPLWNKNRMLFEPFVKVPLSDLTSLNLRIFYGGLSVKVRFLDR